MTRNQWLFVALYALALQWGAIPRALGVPIDGGVAMSVYVALWGLSVVGGVALHCRWPVSAIAFLSISVLTLSVNMLIYLADVGSHSRDISVGQLLIVSVMFAAIASSGLLLPSLRALCTYVFLGVAMGRDTSRPVNAKLTPPAHKARKEYRS